MAVLLNIETATTNCSVSLARDKDIIALKEENKRSYSHAEQLHVFILEAFEEAKINPSAIDAVAVSKGPGSYTGLRIGVSAAKGLCFALNKPLLAISTLEILSYQLYNKSSGFLVPMIDARRMEVYTAIFNSNLKQISTVEAKVLDEHSFQSILNEDKVYFIGSGADKAKTIIKHPNAIFLTNKFPSAIEMARLSKLKYDKQKFEDVAYFEPFYLKDFIALKSNKSLL